MRKIVTSKKKTIESGYLSSNGNKQRTKKTIFEKFGKDNFDEEFKNGISVKEGFDKVRQHIESLPNWK